MGKPYETKDNAMKCHICGGYMQSLHTDVPFKLDLQRIIVIKNVPVEQCESCGEFVIFDHVMEEIDSIIETMDTAAEFEIRHYAA
jgi:YgiT-type zinc finger domain-containing protein